MQSLLVILRAKDKGQREQRTKGAKEQRNKGTKEYHASDFIAFARFSHFDNVKTTFSKSTIFNIYNIGIL